MKCKRLNEVIELLQPAWQKEPELNLMPQDDILNHSYNFRMIG